eukprot:gene93-9982_t
MLLAAPGPLRRRPPAGCYLGLGLAACEASCGDKLLASVGTRDPTLRDVASFYPAMVYDGGFDRLDPAHSTGKAWSPQASGWNAHTYVGSRGASQDAVFDSNAGDVNSVGYPTMNQFLGKYHRSTATFKDALSRLEQREGLWGDYLPVVTLHFKMKQGGWIEWTAVPVADMKGNIAQDVFFRVMKLNRTGEIMDARYFDTYAYREMDGVSGDAAVPGMGHPA